MNGEKSGWMYLSFVDPDKPGEDKFLGALFIKADDLKEAIILAWVCELNPGGEVIGIELPKNGIPPIQWRHRLLSRADILVFEEAFLSKDLQ